MTAAATEDGVFDGGPPLRLEHTLHFARRGAYGALRPAIAVLIAGWVPLALLACVQTFVLHQPGVREFFSDFTVHARSLFAAPLLVLARSICAPRLSAIAVHFADSGILDDKDRGRFDEAIASTRRLLESRISEGVVVALAYIVVISVVQWTPSERLPAWAWAAGREALPAGWWHTFVSAPLVLTFLIGWLWRLVLWTRFLALMGKLDLRLVPAHPDGAAGLGFVGYSLRAYAPVALALGTIAAGGTAAHIVRNGLSINASWFVAGTVALAVVLFCGPLLALSGRLMKERHRGAFAYGALAQRMGQRFESKWLHEGRLDADALESGDFSATTDLYQVVSNVYGMSLIPVDRRNLAILIIASMLPFVPALLLVMPLDTIVSRLAHFLL
jgi:hypothetical protein